MVVVNYVMTAAMTAAFTKQMAAKTAMVAQEVGKLTSKPTVNPAHMMKNRNTASFPAKLNLCHNLLIWFSSPVL